MQALHLDPVAESTADPNSYGFRKGRSTADAISQCQNVVGLPQSAQWILEGDIKACFDQISHDWLAAHIPMDKGILWKWLKAGFIDKNVLYPTEAGTPQGGIISPVAANLTLDGLEGVLRERFPRQGNRRPALVNMVRYADDFIVTGRSKDLLENEVKPLVIQFLKTTGLELSPEKTRISHIEQGFDFLGWNVRKYNGKFLTRPSKRNVKALLAKVRQIIKANKQATAGNLIGLLNPVIRGWPYNRRYGASSATFSNIDHAIFDCLWRWARRRHPNKPSGWVYPKYFERLNAKRWVFHDKRRDQHGDMRITRLFSAASVSIVRHVKIIGAANPYDPHWEPYFERRLDMKMVASPKRKQQLLRLWLRQGGLCPECRNPITRMTGWRAHQIVWLVYGGSTNVANRVLLHPGCHSRLHNHELSVV